MASIFKRTKRKNEPYSIQHVDHQGKRRTVKGFTDKGLSEQLAAKLESDARLRSTGLVDAEQERFAAIRNEPLEDHLQAFENSLSDNSPKHVRLTMTRIRKVVTGCKFTCLADFAPETVQLYLRSQRKTEKLGHKTYNHYLQALDSFCNWCVSTRRLLSNPLRGLERLNTSLDVRHARRALTAEDVSRLVDSARSSGVVIQGFTGEQRARIYLLSYMTGLRKKEIASLSPQSFFLNGTPPTVTIEAACSKHRRKDVLPLHPDLVRMLAEWLRETPTERKLFPGLERKETSVMVRKDLERIGLPYKTAEGIADFHAAGRHTHITELLRNGTSLVEAKELARHSDVNMTMRYTHIGIEDQAKAVANLPSPFFSPNPPEQEKNALQMRCISGVAEGSWEAPIVTENETNSTVTHCRNEDSDNSCHWKPPLVKMAKAGIEPARRLRDTGF